MASKLYEKVANTLVERIEKGLYSSGTKLPSIRVLASEYQVSISTVQEAYRVLEERGYTEVRPKSGHFVKPRVEMTQPHLPSPDQFPVKVSLWDKVLSMLSAEETNNQLNLGWAIPDLEADTLKPLLKSLSQLSREANHRVLGYDRINGCEALRTQVARLAVESGCQLSPDEIIITSGCQEALSCALRAVTEPGDVVAIDSPCYFGASQTIEVCNLKALEIPTHPETGISIEALELALEQWPIKAIAITPTCNNPMGYTVPDEHKARLVELCNQYDIVLIEDDIYGDLAFQYPRPRTVKSYDTQGRVILCSSFSKSVAVGLRVGWVAAGRYRHRMLHLKYVSSVSTSSTPQLAIAEFIAQGYYERHLRKMREQYRRGRDAMIELIQKYFPVGTQTTYPVGGFVIWVVLPEGINTTELNELAVQQGVTVAPGELFSVSGKYQNQLRINYARKPGPEKEHAISLLGDLAKALQVKHMASSVKGNLNSPATVDTAIN